MQSLYRVLVRMCSPVNLGDRAVVSDDVDGRGGDDALFHEQ
jgi:hypothetical protein